MEIKANGYTNATSKKFKLHSDAQFLQHPVLTTPRRGTRSRTNHHMLKKKLLELMVWMLGFCFVYLGPTFVVLLGPTFVVLLYFCGSVGYY